MSRTAGLSPEMTEMVVQTLRQALEREYPDEKKLDFDHREEFPAEVVQKLLSPDVGLHLIFLPENVGGLGGGARDVCRISEEMAKSDLGLATAFLAICLGTDPIIVGGTDEQKQKWLSLIAGGLIVAYGVTEPEAGSNVAALKTVADRVTDDDGKITGYKITGNKQFITNGGVAQIYTILAKAPDGPTFFVVERDTEGFEVGKTEDKLGIRASNTASLMLDEVYVPAENLIGLKEGEGLKQANAVFGYTRLMVGAFGLGGGQGAIDRAIAYANERIQFGTPLIEKQGYTHKLIVPNVIGLEAGRAYQDEIAARIDGGEEGMQVEGSIAKYWNTELGQQAANDAIQALGGYGYTREYMVEKHFRDVRITTIYEGTSEIQQNIIGMFRWKESVKTKGAFYGDLADSLEKLHSECDCIGADMVALAAAGLGELMMYCHRARLTRNQIVLFNLADLVTRVEVAGAFCRKTAGQSGDGVKTAMSRIFARGTLDEMLRLSRLCVFGCVAGSDEENLKPGRELLDGLAARVGQRTSAGLYCDMDEVANSFKE